MMVRRPLHTCVARRNPVTMPQRDLLSRRRTSASSSSRSICGRSAGTVQNHTLFHTLFYLPLSLGTVLLCHRHRSRCPPHSVLMPITWRGGWGATRRQGPRHHTDNRLGVRSPSIADSFCRSHCDALDTRLALPGYVCVYGIGDRVHSRSVLWSLREVPGVVCPNPM